VALFNINHAPNGEAITIASFGCFFKLKIATIVPIAQIAAWWSSINDSDKASKYRKGSEVIASAL
jgi:hypothetical protein